MSESNNDQPDVSSSSSAVEESAATPQKQQEAADAIQQLSLSAESPVTDASEFDPKPIKMSRGNTCSMESLEEICNSLGDSNSETPRKQEPLAPPSATHPEAGSFITPKRATANGTSNSNKDKIILTANHQSRLSQRNLNSDGALQNQNNNFSRKHSRDKDQDDATSSDDDSGVPVPKMLLAPIAGAWGWIQKQNEKQKKKHLQELAEQQVQKLKQAQKNDPTINFTVVEGEIDNGAAFRTPPHSERHLNPGSFDESSHREDEDDISWIPAVRVVEEQVKKDFTPSPRSSRTGDALSPDRTKPIPMVLSPEQMHDIARYVLPKGIAFCRWNRLYSLTRDGDSFWQCLRLCGSEPKTLVVIKTTRGAIFGGYADAPWELKSAHAQGSFHGSASACLFSFSIPDDNDGSSNNDSGGAQPSAVNGTHPQSSKSSHENATTPSTNLKVFHWTGANRYIQYTDTTESRRMLAFGGGGQEGAFGLCVEQDFQFGSTGPCDTFGNLPLCDQENFNIMDMEVWGFLTGQF